LFEAEAVEFPFVVEVVEEPALPRVFSTAKSEKFPEAAPR